MRASTIAASTLMLMVLILSFQPYQVAYSQTAVPLESKALAYVKGVLPFNMNHYTINVDKAYSLPSPPNDPTITQAVEIILKSGDRTIHVVCLYVNGVLHQCGISPVSIPVSDRTYTSMKDVAVRILQAHQEQTGLDSTDLLNALNLVNNTETRNVTWRDVSLSISQFPDIIGSQTVNGMPVPVASNSSFSTTFDWRFIQKGVQYCQVALTFDRGIFCNLQDERATQPIGDNDSTGKEQAKTPTRASIVAAQQENSTSPTPTLEPTNGISAQANQSPTKSFQKTVDTQNELVILLLIIAVAACMIVVINAFTYESKNIANKRKVSK